ncbi:MAG: endonuclease/exonuclease/phosphatase [Cyanobacteria bacterium J06607_17]
MTSQLTAADWTQINRHFQANPTKYGLPQRVYGSAVVGSFNIRKLGQQAKRTPETWEFLAQIGQRFDLLAVQEIMDDLEGFNHLKTLMGDDFQAVVSDRTGVFPGERGLGERLGFLYNTRVVERGDVVSDITFDRSALLKTVIDHYAVLRDELSPYLAYLEARQAWEAEPQGDAPKPPKVQIPIFLTFIRQPFCASFRIVGYPGTKPYKFMAINAHLYFGNSLQDRRQEFDALMTWILGRFQEDNTYYPSFLLLGDLNPDFDNPEADRAQITAHIKAFDSTVQAGANVYFPLLDPHPQQSTIFRTNARQKETFDHIGLFNHDPRLPQAQHHRQMGSQPQGPDYGCFNFVQLFNDALNDKPLDQLTAAEKKAFYGKFEHEVSDHLPIWLRLPLPTD